MISLINIQSEQKALKVVKQEYILTKEPERKKSNLIVNLDQIRSVYLKGCEGHPLICTINAQIDVLLKRQQSKYTDADDRIVKTLDMFIKFLTTQLNIEKNKSIRNRAA